LGFSKETPKYAPELLGSNK